MINKYVLGLCLGLSLGLAVSAAALAADGDKPMTPEQQKEIARFKAIYNAETRRTGDIRIDKANVTLHLGDRFYFLGPDDAKRVLIEGWANPPGSADGVAGIIFPAGRNFLDSWGAVVTYDPTGYVPDKDAKTADYDKLLDESRKNEDDINAARKKDGFEAIHLVGWAQPPTYDSATHSEIWARDIQFAGQKVDTLNYDLRLLNRRGVLSLNLVSAMDALPEARAAAVDLSRTAAFDAGSRYDDYKTGDKKAAYGVAGLVAAGVGVAAAQKFGLLAIGLLVLKKGAVIIAAAVAALGAKFRKLLGLRPKTKVVAPEPAPDPAGPWMLSDKTQNDRK
ncbi:MAG TPA: DUF2167 domain-containing protein [Caulobacteraceae bacterium]|jgi:uncharacterized membrane-anchored protein